MTDHSTNPCARQSLFAGKVRTFNLNDPKVLAMISGGAKLKNVAKMVTISRLGIGRAPLAGQYGDTPAACHKRFLEQVYSDTDVENVIALGLIGGGMAEDEAFALVDEHVAGKPLAANALIASETIAALFDGAGAA
jgi:succinyl-CoA synthetase alpha subunit